MSKKTKQKAKQAKEESKEIIKQELLKKQSAKKVIKSIIGWSITLSGIIATIVTLIVTFYPFLSVSPIHSTSNLPFETRFEIKNESPLPIYHVRYTAEAIEGSPLRKDNRKYYLFDDDITEIPILYGHSSYSAYLDFRNSLRYFTPEAPIAQINIDFNVIFNPFKTQRHFRFFARKNSSGEYKWFPLGQTDRLMFQDDKLPILSW